MKIEASTDHETINRLQKIIMPGDKLADTKQGWWWLVFDDDGQPVAFAGMHPSARFSDAVYLCRAGVIPRARGKGLQRRLIGVRERKARRMGIRWLLTETFDNPASANSLIACGFKTYKPADPWAGNSTYWRKDLSR